MPPKTPNLKIVKDGSKKESSKVSALSPREIVSELDRYVIGQGQAAQCFNGNWVGSLTEIAESSGYWLLLDQNCTQVNVGSKLIKTEFDLADGANLLSFTCNTGLSIEEVVDNECVSGVIGEGEAAQNFNGSWVGSLTNLSPGKGYWFKTECATNLSYQCSEYLEPLTRTPVVEKGKLYVQSSEQSFYFFESIEGIEVGDRIDAYNGHVLVGSREWVGPYTDVPAGDIGVGGREIGFMFGQYKRIRNEFTGVLTGKGLNWGGSLIRPEATGYGAVYFAQEMLKTKNQTFEGKVVAISGSGNVAQFAAEKVIELGGKVVTLSDSSGTIYDQNGIDTEKLEFVKDLKNNKRGRISEYADKFKADYIEGERPWNKLCDVALPCATQNEINLNDAKNLIKNGCFCVAEGANMPTETDAVHEFINSKILFGPGKAANAGGVAVSGLEMSQNSMRISWTKEEVDKRLNQIMKDIHSQCTEHGTEGDFINYVKGANIAGFIKVADSMIDQGVV